MIYLRLSATAVICPFVCADRRPVRCLFARLSAHVPPYRRMPLTFTSLWGAGNATRPYNPAPTQPDPPTGCSGTCGIQAPTRPPPLPSSPTPTSPPPPGPPAPSMPPRPAPPGQSTTLPGHANSPTRLPPPRPPPRSAENGTGPPMDTPSLPGPLWRCANLGTTHAPWPYSPPP